MVNFVTYTEKTILESGAEYLDVFRMICDFESDWLDCSYTCKHGKIDWIVMSNSTISQIRAFHRHLMSEAQCREE